MYVYIYIYRWIVSYISIHTCLKISSVCVFIDLCPYLVIDVCMAGHTGWHRPTQQGIAAGRFAHGVAEVGLAGERMRETAKPQSGREHVGT